MNAYFPCHEFSRAWPIELIGRLFPYIFDAFSHCMTKNQKTGNFDSSGWFLICQLCTDDNYLGGSWPNNIGGINPTGIIPGLNTPARRCQDGRDQDGFRQVNSFRDNSNCYRFSLNTIAAHADCFADSFAANLRQTLPGGVLSDAVRTRVHERQRLPLSILQFLVRAPAKVAVSYNANDEWFVITAVGCRFTRTLSAVSARTANSAIAPPANSTRTIRPTSRPTVITTSTSAPLTATVSTVIHTRSHNQMKPWASSIG